jgi:hypothetical protein
MGPKTDAGHFRAYSRRIARLRAMIARLDARRQEEAQVCDLSLGGAGVRLGVPLQVGDRVTVSFLAPTLWDPLVLPARVSWVRLRVPPDSVAAGLAFEPKDPLSVFALFELVSALAF